MDANIVEFVFLTTILTRCLKSFKIFENSPSAGSRTQTYGTLGQSANHYTKLFCQKSSTCLWRPVTGASNDPPIVPFAVTR